MKEAARPRDWGHIVTVIKNRADYQCECGTGMFECGEGWHYRRCPHTEGYRYQMGVRTVVKLRVVQVKPGDDWMPNNLVAVCKRCLQAYDQKQAANSQERERIQALEAEMDCLFVIERAEANDGPREQN